MKADEKKSGNMNASSREKRDALLGELESIRHLLGEDVQSHDDKAWLSENSRIPLLTHEDGIPTLGPEHQHDSNQPPVSVSVAKSEAVGSENSDTLQAIRHAVSTVAAKKHRPTNTQTLLSSPRDREKLVEDVVHSALPRLESLLRELVQEALLQEKLRSGKKR